VALLSNRELAVAKSIPELDAAVARSGDDLSVIGGEGNGKNVIGVSNETAGGSSSGKLPKAESLVPRGGKSIGTVGGDNL